MSLFIKICRKPDIQMDTFLHYIMSIVGGFLGTYTIINYFGLFPSAQTGNMIEIVRCLFGNNWTELALRIIGFFIYIAGLVSAVLLANPLKIRSRFLAVFLDIAAVIIMGFMPTHFNKIVALYPLFFATAFQWSAFTGARGYVSSTLFSTNNLKQAVTTLTEYIRDGEPKKKEQAGFYFWTIFSYQIGVAFSCLACGTLGLHGIWMCLVPLAVALGALMIERRIEGDS